MSLNYSLNYSRHTCKTQNQLMGGNWQWWKLMWQKGVIQHRHVARSLFHNSNKKRTWMGWSQLRSNVWVRYEIKNIYIFPIKFKLKHISMIVYCTYIQEMSGNETLEWEKEQKDMSNDTHIDRLCKRAYPRMTHVLNAWSLGHEELQRSTLRQKIPHTLGGGPKKGMQSKFLIKTRVLHSPSYECGSDYV